MSADSESLHSGRAELPRIAADFGFTQEHELLRESARRFLSGRCPIAEVRRLAADPVGFDPELWERIAELGWIGLLTSAELGGAAVDHLQLALLLEEMGRLLLPSPYLGCLLALRALERHGTGETHSRYARAITGGSLIASVALSEPGGSWEPEQVEARAEPEGDAFRLSGIKTHAAFGANAGLLLAPFRMPDGGVELFAIELPAPQVSVIPEVNVDVTRRTARVSIERQLAPPESRLQAGAQGLASLYAFGCFALAAEMVGGADAVLGRTRDYATERRQFGRAIGAFQAVKHPIVDMLVGVELARSLVLGAAVSFDQDPEHAETAARMAKSLASDVFSYAVRKSVQLHGGFGFTWDCDVHFYFKRALASRGMLGDAAHHRRHLAAQLLG